MAGLPLLLVHMSVCPGRTARHTRSGYALRVEPAVLDGLPTSTGQCNPIVPTPPDVGPQLPCQLFPLCEPRSRANALHHRSVEWCLPTPRNPEGELSSQWLILPSRLHVVLPAGSCPPCRPFMTAPPKHHTADDAEHISSICGACMIERRRHQTRTQQHTAHSAPAVPAGAGCRGCGIGRGMSRAVP